MRFPYRGQYLAPSHRHYPVVDYIHPEVFKEYEEIALGMGFKHAAGFRSAGAELLPGGHGAGVRDFFAVRRREARCISTPGYY